MRTSARVLQVLSAAFGAALLLVGVVSGDRALEGGLLMGSVMFLAAMLLGADSSTNAESVSRRFYKAGFLLVAAVFVGVTLVALWRLVGEGQWLSVLGAVLKIAVFAVCAMGVGFDRHPRVRRLLAALGQRRDSGPS